MQNELEVTKIEQSETHCLLDLFIPLGMPFFKDHFKEVPIVPGAFQVQWATDLAQKYGLIEKKPTLFKTIKFKAMLKPDTHVKLLLNKTKKGTIKFTLENESEIFALGQFAI